MNFRHLLGCDIIGTLSSTVPSTRCGGQLFQLISLSLDNTHQLKELETTWCSRPHAA